MGENIDPTWLAFSGATTLEEADVDARLRRVERHYGALVDYPLTTRRAVGGRSGLAIVGDADPRSRWPHFSEAADLAIATAHLPGGWSRLLDGSSGDAGLRLARAVAEDPDRVIATLSAPVAIAVLDRRSGGMWLVNDALGAARVFSLEVGGLTMWSNRPGALALFAGVRPRADERGWRILAAAGWLLADASPMAGVRRLRPGTVVTVSPSGEVRRRESGAIGALVRPQGTMAELAPLAAQQMTAQAREAARMWPETADVDLSGGRDSRVVAAAVAAAGIDARYRTSDATPGEAGIARRLVELAPAALEHRVGRRRPGSASPGTPLLERARNLHRLHDGVRHPQKLRGKMTLPRPRPERPKFSGHGGEIAHGFFYKSRGEIRRLRGPRRRLTRRVMRFFTQGHDAALAESASAAEAVVEQTLDEGRELGLRGPALLDWFYLVDRFAHRSGIATDSERTALFAAPAVIAASFALKPRERVAARLHDELISRFVPEWGEVPYFKPTRARAARIRRERLWEVDGDAAVVGEILAAGGSWTETYDREQALAMWSEARAGRAQPKWESLFEGIVYRATFDQHLDELGRAATG